MSDITGALKRMTSSGVQRIAGVITTMRKHTSGAVTDGPCDAVWVTVDGATIVGTMADGESITTPALPNKQWVPISMSSVTVSSGDVYVGWFSV